jgi:hypothetical protein
MNNLVEDRHELCSQIDGHSVGKAKGQLMDTATKAMQNHSNLRSRTTMKGELVHSLRLATYLPKNVDCTTVKIVIVIIATT